MHVITPEQGMKNRVGALKRQKSALRAILCSSPYIDIAWDTNKEEKCPALIDTGADWSLIDETLLDENEKQLLANDSAGLEGQGVSGEKIPILGEVWRDFKVGGMTVTSQRFVVVQGMTSDIILGADFWGRVSPIQLDFSAQKLSICGGTVVVNTHGGQQARLDEGTKQVKVTSKCSIPPQTEMMVNVKAKGMREGHAYLFQPVRTEDDKVGSPFAVVGCKDELGDFQMKITNLGKQDVVINEGRVLGTLESDMEAVVAKLGRVEATDKPKADLLSKVTIGNDLSNCQQSQIAQMLRDFEDVFYQGGPLPLVDIGVKHAIRGHETIAPIACRPRRLDPQSEREVREEVDKLLEMGVIRPSNSPWAAPVVCARRADGSLRLALDYRKVNEVTHPATLHPIPLIEDLLDRLSSAKFFSVLDAKAGYHQMPLREEDSEVSAFVVPWAQYEWAERTPFGLKGAGYSFQRMMAMLLGSSNFVEALCYLDDILIWGETWEIHIERLRVVLSKVQAAGLALSPEKCKFGVSEVAYLGSVIRNGMISISDQRVKDLLDLPSPTTVRELRRVLGAFGFVQRWLPGIAEVTKPLNNGVKGKPHSKLTWTVDMEEAFVKLKKLVAEATSLRIPDHSAEFTLISDCSDVGAGAVLTQEEGGCLVPVAFYHHTLGPAEQRYNTTDKELLAAVLAIRKFRVYLTKGFNLVTDHQAVKWLNRLDVNDEKGRRGRWLETMEQYEINLIHKPGRGPEMSMADYLSRIIHDKGKEVLRGNKIPLEIKRSSTNRAMIASFEGKSPADTILSGISLEEIKIQQGKDSQIGEVKNAFLESRDSGGDVEMDKELVKTVVDPKAFERLYLDARELLMVKFNGGRRSNDAAFGVKKRDRIVLPPTMRQKALAICHSRGLGGHMGRDRTWQRVRNSFYWKDMKKDVEGFVKECEACACNKHSTHPNVAPLQETDLPSGPLKHIQFDYAGPFQAAQTHPFRYVLQVQDILSRYLQFFPCRDDTAKTAAEMLMNHWICYFGTPRKANSDRGTHFVSETFEALCKTVGIEHRLGAPKHPESQGQCERQNQLLAQVRCMCDNDVEKWPEAVYRVAFAHNVAQNRTTGIPPLQMLLGQEPQTPEIAWLRDEASVKKDEEDERTFAERILHKKEEAIARMIKQARETTKQGQLKRMEAQKTRGKPYVVGDLVRIKLDSYELKKKGKKMARKYSGKYKVTKILKGGWTYLLEPCGWKGRMKTRHFNSLKDAERLTPTVNNSDSDMDGPPNTLSQTGNDREDKEGQSSKDIPSPITEVKLPKKKETKCSGAVPDNMNTGRPKRKTKPPTRLQVGLESEKRYLDSNEGGNKSIDSGEESSGSEEQASDESEGQRSDSEDSEWYSGISTGSPQA